MLRQAARWLVILMTSLVVLPGHVFATHAASAKTDPAHSCCDEKCRCCVSEPTPAPVNPAAPAAPARVAVGKDFQFSPLAAFSLTPAMTGGELVSVRAVSPSAFPSAPLHQRLCVYLL
jgi:hypothetical protein